MIKRLIRVFTLRSGLEEYNDVIAVRIVSKDYNLLILKDYVPIIGKVEGYVEIEQENTTKKIDDIVAYYICSNNEFNLLIEGE